MAIGKDPDYGDLSQTVEASNENQLRQGRWAALWKYADKLESSGAKLEGSGVSRNPETIPDNPYLLFKLQNNRACNLEVRNDLSPGEVRLKFFELKNSDVEGSDGIQKTFWDEYEDPSKNDIETFHPIVRSSDEVIRLVRQFEETGSLGE